MADFHQNGPVATFHRLQPGNLESLEDELTALARRTPIALVLPCLFAEFSRAAIHHIIDELRHVRYLDTIVVSLGQAGADDLLTAKSAFARLPQRVSFVWNDGPAIQALYALLGKHGLGVPPDGKGRSCWIGHGYVLAEGRCDVIAAHDCDIKTYSRELLARLSYPIANTALGFEFAKGYYARVAGGLNGRVTRLLVTPLLAALQRVIGNLPLLAYLDSFRYALAGEFAMRTDVARANRIPCNWGLEIAVLAEAYRHCGPRRVCQTELCSTYDHKHQALSAGDPSKGLLKMSIDISEVLLRALAAEGAILSDAVLKTLRYQYVRSAEDIVDRYAADAAINQIPFNRDAEEMMASVFARGVATACERYSTGTESTPTVPSWQRVVAAIPHFLELLREAVEQDSAAVAAA